MSKKIDDVELELASSDAIGRARLDDDDDPNGTEPGCHCGMRINKARLEADVALLIQLLGTPVRKNQAKEPAGLGWSSPSRFRH